MQKHVAWVDSGITPKHLLQISNVRQIFLFFSHANKYLSIVQSSEEIHANIYFPGNICHDLLTAQGGEQPSADAPSSLALQRGQECSLISSMEKV